MIKKIRKTLKTAPTKNYFCLLDTSLNEHEFENKDNKFIFESSVLISERRHELNKKSSFPGSTAPSNTIYQSDWNGCVSYIPTVEGFLINISMVKNYDGEAFDIPLLSALRLLKNWMIRNNEDIAMSKSLFTSLGNNHSKSIEKLIYEVFDNDDSPTVYITKSL